MLVGAIKPGAGPYLRGSVPALDTENEPVKCEISAFFSPVCFSRADAAAMLDVVGDAAGDDVALLDARCVKDERKLQHWRTNGKEVALRLFITYLQ